MNAKIQKTEAIKKEVHPNRLLGVVSQIGKMTNTITVSVERAIWHPKIRKQYKRTKKYLVHDPKNEAGMGDLVVIENCKPVSKRKYFRLIEIKKKGAPVFVEETEKEGEEK